MTRIPIKEEDIYVIDHSKLMWSDPIRTQVIINFDGKDREEEGEQLKQQILQDHEIVNRLNERIKECKSELTTYHRQLLLELQKIRDGK